MPCKIILKLKNSIKILSGGYDGEIYLFDLNTLTRSKIIKVNVESRIINQAKLTKNFELIVSDNNRRINIYDLEKIEPKFTFTDT